MPKQRRDSEPVGQGTDHGSLCKGPDVAEPRPLIETRAGNNKHSPHEHQEPERQQAHAFESTLALLTVFDRLPVNHYAPSRARNTAQVRVFRL